MIKNLKDEELNISSATFMSIVKRCLYDWEKFNEIS